jgi:hypothetical protein
VIREVLALGGVLKGDFRSLAELILRTDCNRQGLAAAAAQCHDEHRADLGQDFDAVIRLIFVEIATTGIRPILLQPSSFNRLCRRRPSRQLSYRRRPSSRLKLGFSHAGVFYFGLQADGLGRFCYNRPDQVAENC